MTTAADAHEQFLELGAQLSDEEFADAFASAIRNRTTVVTDWSAYIVAALQAARPANEADVLDAAAAIAASHRSLADRESYLRSLLALVAAQSDFVRELGGEPRRVLDDIERSLMQRIRLQGEAIRAIWRQPMLQARDAASALGAEPTNRERVRQLRLRSELLGLQHGRGYLYPAFQFDAERRCIDAAVSEVNRCLDALNDPWGVASWWFSVNDRVGTRPSELVGTGRHDDLVAIAAAVIEPIG